MPENAYPPLTRLLRWLWDFAPAHLSVLICPVAWLRCKVHGHEGWTEMDNRTIVCVWCARVLGRTNV